MARRQTSPILALAAAVPLLLAPASAAAQGRIIVETTNAPNVGFNDPTPVAPVGGNTGTTLGQQRLKVFQYAASIWETRLKPKEDIYIIATFQPLAAGVLGSAGTTHIIRNFAGAELPNTWYHAALADHLAGVDHNPVLYDISVNFSTNFAFYNGLDGNEGTLVDMAAVALHEIGHGLGVANFVNEVTGTLNSGGADIYSQYTLDVTTDKIWNEMTNAERQASAINVRKVSWSGLHVNQAVPQVLSPGEPTLFVQGPSGLGPYMMGPAGFGSRLPAAGLTGPVVLADDGVAPGSDACTAFPPASAAAIAGHIALVDRGTCAFTVKVKNAQDAGAIAVLVADNAADTPPSGLGGADPTITIPSARILRADGLAIKAALAGGVTATMGFDYSVIAGTDRERGLMMVASLNPVALGSSISHFEAVASRNQLMEPSINADLTHSVEPPEDLTLPLMTDIGWFSDGDGVPDGVDSCIGSDRRATVVIDNCDSGAPNTVFSDGCRTSDLVAACNVGAKNHGQYVSCVSHTTNELKKAGIITGQQKGAIQGCAARN